MRRNGSAPVNKANASTKISPSPPPTIVRPAGLIPRRSSTFSLCRLPSQRMRVGINARLIRGKTPHEKKLDIYAKADFPPHETLRKLPLP
jgi:hypothetical protein